MSRSFKTPGHTGFSWERLKNYPSPYNQLNPAHAPYNQFNHCEHAGPASQFRRAEDGPRSGRGRGRWRLQVFSKCFEWTANGLRNPSKRTERSLNFRTEMSQHFILYWQHYFPSFRELSNRKFLKNTTSQASSSEWLPKSDLVGPNSEHFVCWS